MLFGLILVWPLACILFLSPTILASVNTNVIELRTPTPVPAPTPDATYFTGVSITPPSTSHHIYHTETSLSLNLPATCTPTIKPDENGHVPPGTCNALYDYYPSFGAAVLFSSLFGVVTILHLGQAIWFKKRFCWVLIMGAAWELASYVSRSISTRHQQSSGLATVSQLFVLLAPLWINAFIYTVFARVFYFTLPSTSLLGLRASALATIFVLLDISSFIIQLIGGGMAGAGAPPDQIKKGLHIYMGGIGLQEAFVVIFTGLVVLYNTKMLKEEREKGVRTEKKCWRKVLAGVYVGLGLITLRIVFRLIEFHSGTSAQSNTILTHEAYLYVFDACPMLFAIMAWNISHPGEYLIGPAAELPSSPLGRFCRKFCCCCCGKGKKRGKMHQGAGLSKHNGGYGNIESAVELPLNRWNGY